MDVHRREVISGMGTDLHADERGALEDRLLDGEGRATLAAGGLAEGQTRGDRGEIKGEIKG